MQNPCLIDKRGKAHAGNLRHPFVTRVGNNVEQFGYPFAPDRRDDAKFGKVSPDRINHRRLLANKQMPCAVKHQAALLLRRLGGHKPHVGSGDSLLLVDRLKRRTRDLDVLTLCEYVHGTDVHGTVQGFRRPGDVPWTRFHPPRARCARSQAVRLDSAAVVVLTALKVLLVDMHDLTNAITRAHVR